MWLGVSYAKPQTGSKLKGAGGAEVANFTWGAVTNLNTPGPRLRRGEACGNKLRLYFDQPLAAAANLHNSAFTVHGKTLSGSLSITRYVPDQWRYADGYGLVTLTLASKVRIADGDLLFVDYTAPNLGSNNTLISTAGALVQNFAGAAVFNLKVRGYFGACVGGVFGHSGPEEAASATLSVSPNPVQEGSPVTVTATLSAALSADVSIPVTVSRGTSEATDHGTLASITVSAGQTAGSGAIATHSDPDGDDETFTMALDTGRLPTPVTAGIPASQTVTITDTTEVTAPPLPVFPAAPNNLQAEAGDGQVQLTWGDVAGATGWQYQQDSGSWTGAGSGATTHTVTGLVNGTEYTFKVRATQLGVLSGNASASVKATPTAGANALQGQQQAPPAPPAAVAAVSATHNGGTLSVSWAAPARAAAYDVVYQASGATAWSWAATDHASASLTISGVDVGKTYTVG